jgi:hypothetical protein
MTTDSRFGSNSVCNIDLDNIIDSEEDGDKDKDNEICNYFCLSFPNFLN